jgi:hypothetical protein
MSCLLYGENMQDPLETVGWDFYGDAWSFAMMREVLGIGAREYEVTGK